VEPAGALGWVDGRGIDRLMALAGRDVLLLSMTVTVLFCGELRTIEADLGRPRQQQQLVRVLLRG